MKILVITQYYYPEDFRINDICEELVKRGNEVTVVTGIPNYPKGEIYKGYEESYKTTEILNGVQILRCNNRPRKKGIFNLILNYYTYVRKANKIIKSLDTNYDVVYAYEISPITLVLPGIKYAKRNKVPLYLYCLDIWPEAVRELKPNKILSQKNLIYLLAKFISKKIYSKADLIGVKCNYFIDYLNDVCKVPKNKCELIYEHAESNYLSIPEEPIDNGVVDFVFLGNMGSTCNCKAIIDAIKLININQKFLVHFVGDGSETENLREEVIKNNLQNKIIFHGRCSQQEVLDYYKYADICLLTLSNRTQVGLTLPAKLTGYMAASRPIIGAICGESQEIIKKSNCGFVVDSSNIKGLADLIQYSVDNNENIRKKGKNGRKYFLENFTLEKHIDKLEKQLNELIEKEKNND